MTVRRDGGVAARRAVVRWAWRLLRREWRQQVLVLGLLTLAVTAAVGGVAVAYHGVSLREAEFGTANQLYELDASNPGAAEADLAAVRDRFGTVEVIGHQDGAVPGSATTVDVRSQDPDGAFGRPMLALREGRYPAGADEVALSDGVAALYGAEVGSHVELGSGSRDGDGSGSRLRVVGLVENPADLDDEFALLDPDHAPPPRSLTLLLRATPEQAQAFPALVTEAVGRTRGHTERTAAALGVLSVATLAMLLVALIAAAGFVVVAQRRLRQLGMLAAVGATERHLRLVTLANGMAVGTTAALLGAVAGLGAWVPLAPRLEPLVGHRIDRFDLPWATLGGGLLVAVVMATAAAWWPARTMARVPVVAALSGRPPRPRPARRSAVLGALLLAAGAALVDLGIDVREDRGNGLLAAGGIVALVTGLLLVGPLAIRALASLGGRAPVALRLALRDLRRYQARSGAALAAVTFGLGIPAAIVVGAAAAEPAPDEGNLAGDQLLVRPRTDPVPDRPARELARLEDQVARIVDSLGDRDPTVLVLDVAVDPEYDPQGGPPYVRLATPVDEGTYRDASVPYVATPELLAYAGIDPADVDPGTDVVTAERGELRLVNTAWYLTGDSPEAVTEVQRIDAPGHSEVPTSLLTPEGLARRGWERARAGWFVDTGAPLTGEQITRARELAAEVGLTVETRDGEEGLATLRSGATAAGVLLALGILGMAVGLIRGESAADLRTLTAMGATSAVRRALTATTAGALALLGVLLGAAGAYVGLIAGYAEDLDELRPVPVAHLAVLVVVLPLAAAVAGWLLAGRGEPPALARGPIE